jgi:hypothetical protein
VRIYNPDWQVPTQFSAYGPRHRFDHHRDTGRGPADDPKRRVYYAADDFKGCLVEKFGDTGVISVGNKRVAGVRLKRSVRLLDLRGDGALAVGSVAALASIPDRPMSQAWARWFYEHTGDFGVIDGIAYLNAHNHDLAYVLFERAEDAVELVADLPLADPALRSRIREVAVQCNMIVQPY